MLIHPFPPIYNSDSQILILGSFPSVASRKQQFYYGHPSNRFWAILAELFKSKLPKTIEEKKEFLLQNKIALYDAVQSCSIVNSEDASMKEIVPAELDSILKNTNIKKIFANGNKAYEVCVKQIGIDAIKLPSTSAANARFRFDDLLFEWQKILK